MNFPAQIKGKNVLLFGLGLQGGGVGDALYLIKHQANVRLTDLRSAAELSSSLTQLPPDLVSTFGSHTDADIDWADLIIKNPGVPDDQAQIAYAKSRGIPVVTSIALVVQAARNKVIGITGTRGKSTTANLVYKLLVATHGENKVILGGNIPGTSGLALLDSLPSCSYLVLELSSFQLHYFHELNLSPSYACLTNLYPDHLNRYPNMVAYAYDKAAIFSYQNSADRTFVCKDNELALSLASKTNAQLITYSKTDVPSEWHPKLLGEHNLENIAAALAIGRELGVSDSTIKQVVNDFVPLPFRLELIREVKGVKYYNDTTSTTPTATIKAIHAMTDPTVLILGGADKQLPFNELVEVVSNSDQVKAIVLLGCRQLPDFVKALKTSCPDKIKAQVFSMPEAVQSAASLSANGWQVLLSPGFTSFDLFNNEFDRGRQFNQAVKALSA